LSSPTKRPSVDPLAANLKAHRERLGLSFAQVAERVGVTKGAAHGWEQGAQPARETLDRLAELYGTSSQALRYGADRVSEPTPSYVKPVALGIPQRIRVWLQEFLLDLTKAGVSGEEIDGIRRILSSDEMYRYYVGGEPKEYSEDETLEGIQAHAEAFRRDLRRRGYKLPK
jgi:transcriptional regulator with XRE-family HTH domain